MMMVVRMEALSDTSGRRQRGACEEQEWSRSVCVRWCFLSLSLSTTQCVCACHEKRALGGTQFWKRNSKKKTRNSNDGRTQDTVIQMRTEFKMAYNNWIGWILFRLHKSRRTTTTTMETMTMDFVHKWTHCRWQSEVHSPPAVSLPYIQHGTVMMMMMMMEQCCPNTELVIARNHCQCGFASIIVGRIFSVLSINNFVTSADAILCEKVELLTKHTPGERNQLAHLAVESTVSLVSKTRSYTVTTSVSTVW